MDSLINNMKSAALGVGEFFTPVLSESKFRETGVLTPEEFLTAGEHLVHHCPTWSWARASDPSRTKPFLPADRQFLITKGVPCYRRCRDMEYDSSQEKILGQEDLDFVEGGDGEGWVDTHHYSTDVVQKVSEMRLSGDHDSLFAQSALNNQDLDEDDEDLGPPMDMEAFMAQNDDLEEEDPNRLQASNVPKADVPSSSQASSEKTIATRTYDLHITYDKFYQVPRMWLVGYSEQRKPLEANEMYEDFSQDHAKKTITMETHPHLKRPSTASIHPCRHAEVMKRLMDQLAENRKELGVHEYLLIFLKFVQAVIPTIEYDYTRSIQL